MNKKIIHLITDDKFVENAKYQFEKIFPKKNYYKLFIFNTNEKLKFVSLNSNTEVYETSKTSFDDVVENIEANDLVVLHGLNKISSKIVLKFSKRFTFLWLFWGAEIYNHPSQPLGDFYSSSTRKEFNIKTTSNYWKNIARFLYYKIKFNSDYYENLRAAKKIQFFANFNPLILDLLLKKKLLNKNVQHISYLYYPLEFLFNNDNDMKVVNNNILIGNCAYPSLNHLDIFHLLKSFDNFSNKVIVPISYGDESYAKRIKEIGSRIYEDLICFFDVFMTLDEYHKKLQNCGVAIFNNYRMQSNGNIYALLWMGSKVYLSEKNITYHYLKKLGLNIFSIEKELNNENPNKFRLLSEDQFDENRKILKRFLSKEFILPKLKYQIEQIFEEIE